jgi:hypothetical protein
MTRSKLEFATILATLRGQGEDPQKLAQEMTLRKLCYEIERAEEELAKVPEPELKEPPPKKLRPLWDRLTFADSDEESS